MKASLGFVPPLGMRSLNNQPYWSKSTAKASWEAFIAMWHTYFWLNLCGVAVLEKCSQSLTTCIKIISCWLKDVLINMMFPFRTYKHQGTNSSAEFIRETYCLTGSFFVSFWAGFLKCQILFFNYFPNSSKFWHVFTTPRSLAREEPDVCQSVPGPFPSTRESSGAYQEGDVVSGDALGILCMRPLDREAGTLIMLCASWRSWELLEAPLGVEEWFLEEVGAAVYPLVWEHPSITSPSPCYFPGGRYSVVWERRWSHPCWFQAVYMEVQDPEGQDGGGLECW